MQMQYLAAAGILADVTEDAKRLGFGPDRTYPALGPALFFDGRQYAFPRNPAQTMYWVNKETFARHGQPLPPSRWTSMSSSASERPSSRRPIRLAGGKAYSSPTAR